MGGSLRTRPLRTTPGGRKVSDLFQTIDHFAQADYIIAALFLAAGAIWIASVIAEHRHASRSHLAESRPHSRAHGSVPGLGKSFPDDAEFDAAHSHRRRLGLTPTTKEPERR